MKPWGVVAIVVGVGAVIAIGYGSSVGAANQVTYLIEPLRRAQIDLFARDWLATETTHYHGAFVALATELFRADSSGATAFGLAHLLAMIATIGALFAVLVSLGASHQNATLLLLAGFITLGGGRALGGSYLVATYFQPSSIATAAWIAALALWLRERHLAAGLTLAIGGAFHVNFLVLGIAWFGAVEVLTWRALRTRRVLALLGPSVVVLIAMWPHISAAADASEPALALRVLVEFHAPTHYDARVAIVQLPPLLGWMLAAWAFDPARERVVAALFRAAVIGAAMCTLVFLAILVVPSTTRLFVWRIAPFAQLAFQIVVVLGAFSERTVRGSARRIALVAGTITVVVWSVPYANGLYTVALACVLVAALAHRVRRSTWFLGVAAGVVVVLSLTPVARKLVAPVLFTEASSGRYADAIAWARTTDLDALFVVPPYAHAFRLLSRRAVVADSRSPPLYPDELVAWYRRLCAIVSVDHAATHEEIEARYDRLTPEELAAAARRFDAQYVVIDKQRSRSRLPGEPAFEDWRVVVFAVR